MCGSAPLERKPCKSFFDLRDSALYSRWQSAHQGEVVSRNFCLRMGKSVRGLGNLQRRQILMGRAGIGALTRGPQGAGRSSFDLRLLNQYVLCFTACDFLRRS